MVKYIVFFIIPVYFFLSAISVAAQPGGGQNSKIDSLKSVLNRLNSAGEFKTSIKGQSQGIDTDTIRIKTLNNLAWELHFNNTDTALVLINEVLTILEQLHKSNTISASDKKRLGHFNCDSYNQLSVFYKVKGNYPMALEYGLKSLKIAESLNDKRDIYSGYINIGSIYMRQSNYPEALNFYLKALKIANEAENKGKISLALSKIGVVYDLQGNYSKALEYYFKALAMDEVMKDKDGIASNLVNIGIVYKEQSDYNKALKYYLKALKIFEELEDKGGRGTILCNLSNIYTDQGNYEEALKHAFSALKIEEQIGDSEGIVINLGNIGGIYVKQKKYPEAEKYLKNALALAHTIGSLQSVMEVEDNLHELYAETNRPAEALVHYKKYVIARDSIYNNNKTQKIVRAEMNFEFEETQAIAKAEQEKKDAIALQEKQKQKNILISIFCFLILVVVFASFMFNRWRVTQKQKRIIEKQKEKIVDSITYAQLIQESILKEESEIQKHLPDSFIYYQPKDIVSGDFYWFSTVAGGREPEAGREHASNSQLQTPGFPLKTASELIIIAAVDCTGHGVPGAFMSMIGNTLLNQIVNERKITMPSQILQLLHQGITEALHQEKEGSLSHDGMDISLCCIDYSNNQIQFAGAQNPLYVVSGNKLQEIKGDIYSIGSNAFIKNNNVKIEFTNHILPLEKGACIYMFTDGYSDQFGGGNNKKMGTARFREFLLTIRDLSLPQQKEAVVNMLNNWKGGTPQIDDILVIGVRI